MVDPLVQGVDIALNLFSCFCICLVKLRVFMSCIFFVTLIPCSLYFYAIIHGLFKFHFVCFSE